MIGKYLLKQLNDLRRSDTLCDLELISGDGNSFKVHHIVFLALNPQYYEKHCMERRYQNPTMNKNMLLSCVKYEELKAVVDFIYGKPVVLRSRFEVLKKALEKLSMGHLIEEAGGFTFMPEETEVKTEIENTEVKTEPEDPSFKTGTQPLGLTKTADNDFTSTETASLPSEVNLSCNNSFTNVQKQLPLIETTLTCFNSLTNTQIQPARIEPACNDGLLNDVDSTKVEIQNSLMEANLACKDALTTTKIQTQVTEKNQGCNNGQTDKTHFSSWGKVMASHQCEKDNMRVKLATDFNKEKVNLRQKSSAREKELGTITSERERQSGSTKGNSKYVNTVNTVNEKVKHAEEENEKTTYNRIRQNFMESVQQRQVNVLMSGTSAIKKVFTTFSGENVKQRQLNVAMPGTYAIKKVCTSSSGENEASTSDVINSEKSNYKRFSSHSECIEKFSLCKGMVGTNSETTSASKIYHLRHPSRINRNQTDNDATQDSSSQAVLNETDKSNERNIPIRSDIDNRDLNTACLKSYFSRTEQCKPSKVSIISCKIAEDKCRQSFKATNTTRKMPESLIGHKLSPQVQSQNLNKESSKIINDNGESNRACSDEASRSSEDVSISKVPLPCASDISNSVIKPSCPIIRIEPSKTTNVSKDWRQCELSAIKNHQSYGISTVKEVLKSFYKVGVIQVPNTSEYILNYTPIQPMATNVQTAVSSFLHTTLENNSTGAPVSLIKGNVQHNLISSKENENQTDEELKKKSNEVKIENSSDNGETKNTEENQYPNIMTNGFTEQEGEIQGSEIDLKTYKITNTRKKKKNPIKHTQVANSKTLQKHSHVNKNGSKLKKGSKVKDNKIANTKKTKVKDNKIANAKKSKVKDNKIANTKKSKVKDNKTAKTKKSKVKDNEIANTKKTKKRAIAVRNQFCCKTLSKEIKSILKSKIVDRQKNEHFLKVDEGYPTTQIRPFGTDQVNIVVNKDTLNDQVYAETHICHEDTTNDQVNNSMNNGSKDTLNDQVYAETHIYHKDTTNHQVIMDANKDCKNTPNDQVNIVVNYDPKDTLNAQVNADTNIYHKDTTNDQVSMELNNDREDSQNYQVNTDTNNFHKDTTNDQVIMDAKNERDKPENTSYRTYCNNTETSALEQNDYTSDEMKDISELKKNSETSDLKKNKMKEREFSTMEKISDKLTDIGNEKHDKKNEEKIGFLSNQRNLIAMSSKCEARQSIKSPKRNCIRKNLFEIDFSKFSTNTGEMIEPENSIEADSDNHYNEPEDDQTNCETEDGVGRESVNIQNDVESKLSSDKEIVCPNKLKKAQDMPMLGDINVSLCCPLNKDDILQDASQSADEVECQTDLLGVVQDVSQNPGDNQTCLQSGEDTGSCSANTIQKSDRNFNKENTCVDNINQEIIRNELDSLGKDESIVTTEVTIELDKSKVKYCKEKDQTSNNTSKGVETENNKLSLLYKNCVPEPINMVKLSLISSLENFSPTDTSNSQMSHDIARKLDKDSYSRSDHQQTRIGKFQEIVTCLSRIRNKSPGGSSEKGNLQQPINENSHKERSRDKDQDCSCEKSNLLKSYTKDSHQNKERCDEIVKSTSSKSNVPDKEILKLKPSDVKDRTKKMKEPTKRKKVKASCDMRGKMIIGTEESSSVALLSCDLPVRSVPKLGQPSQVKKKRSFIRRKVQPSGHELKKLLDKRTISVKLYRLPTLEISKNVLSKLTDTQSNQSKNLVQNRESENDCHLDFCIGPGSIWRDNPLGEPSNVQKGTEKVVHANGSSKQVLASSKKLKKVNGMHRQTDEELLQLCYEKQRHEMLNNDISQRKLAPKSSPTVETGPKIPVFCYKVFDSKVALCPITQCQNFAPIAPKPSHSDEETNKTEASVSNTNDETEQMISDKEGNACRNEDQSCLEGGCDFSDSKSRPEIKISVNEDTPLSELAKSLNKTSKTRIRKSKSKIKEESTPLSVLAKNLKLKRKTKKSKSKPNDKNKQFKTPYASSKQAGDDDLKINGNSSSVPRQQIQEMGEGLKMPNFRDSNAMGNISESCENVLHNKRKLNDDSVCNNVDDSDNKKVKVGESTDDTKDLTKIPKFHGSLSESKHGTLSKGSTGSYRFYRRSVDLHRKWSSVKKKSPLSPETVGHQDNVLFEFDSREVLRKKLSFK